jgi:hypothetical protein
VSTEEGFNDYYLADKQTVPVLVKDFLSLQLYDNREETIDIFY